MESNFPYLDLNLAPEPISTLPPKLCPKIEPKPEPFDPPSFTLLTPPLNPNPIPNPNPTTTPAAVAQPLLSAAEAGIYAEFLRISHLFRQAFADKLRRRRRQRQPPPPTSLAVVPTLAPSSTAIVPAGDGGRKRKRSGEMVRATLLGPFDLQFFRAALRRTRATYESLRLFLLQEEQRLSPLGPGCVLGKRGRADLKSATVMMDRGLWLNRDKRLIGAVPGVDVGSVFYFRIELCVVGLHGCPQAGIDYVPASVSSSREPIATSIIVSGGYEDDEDRGDVIIYTGHGGKDRHFLRHSVHQQLHGGNLALERSSHYGIEIRVIRGLRCDRSPSGKVYVYEGLYRIVSCWLDTGKSGFEVYKYKLVRMAGQPEMGTVVMKFAENLIGDPLSSRPSGYLSLDMSKGREKLPVYLFNDVDNDREPLLYDYLVCPVYPPPALHAAGSGGGCDCVAICSVGCRCVERNGGEVVYDSTGILLKGKPLIYECGPHCRCPPNCHNRVTQRGVKHRLEVFRSRETGWGVRSLDAIRAGAFICEYSGIVLTPEQAEVVAMNGDSLVHPNRFPSRWVEWGDISTVYPEYIRPAFPSLPPLHFAMDVSRMRNAACYFSHSCSPNVLVQFVLYDHYNVSYPHLMLFAMEHILPLRELSIDYGIDAWSG